MSTTFVSTQTDRTLDEAVMTDADFERIVARIHREAGIVLKRHKKQMVRSRVSRRLSARNMGDFARYLDLLDDPKESEELTAFVNALTTNLTSFFREAHHFNHLADSVFPRLINQQNPIRIWSAGCSSGEEAVSIVLVAQSLLRDRGPFDFKVLATDIDTSILARASTGRYPRDRAKETLDRFQSGFTKVSEEGMLQVAPGVLSSIRYLPLNLLGPWPMQRPFDAIFCRNVLIYFDSSTKKTLVDRFVAQLRVGGMLYLGHSEALLANHPNLRAEAHTAYRKTQ
jgi:chemotaxis protein methyltransferase CheR